MIINELSKCAEIIAKQRQFFQTGKTKDITFRIAQLKILKQLVIENKEVIIQALKADLHKPEFETYATEIGVSKEIDYALKHINNWTKPQKAAVPLDLFPYSAKIYPELVVKDAAVLTDEQKR
ncbi:hypothetical protein MEN41_16560, partial [Dolichospermum sp. ST_con]|nr:hypothetical protein [Dolichospermum sp. ST_con]